MWPARAAPVVDDRVAPESIQQRLTQRSWCRGTAAQSGLRGSGGWGSLGDAGMKRATTWDRLIEADARAVRVRGADRPSAVCWRRGLKLLIGVLAVLAAEAWPASTALAAGRVYWADTASGTIRVGNLNGTGASNLFTGENGPYGVTLDPAAGKIYWADFGAGTIRVANLDGTGSPSTLFSGESGAMGVAVDQAAGKIYWSDDSTGQIRVGNLNGTGASDLYTGEMGPTGVAIDPVSGKVYWGATASSAVRVGSLNGSGVASDLFSGQASPFGVAIDPALGRIYWGSYYGAAVRLASLRGTGSPSNLFSEQSQAEGVAIDPASGQIYWAIDSNPGGSILVGNLSGKGSPHGLFTDEPGATFVALLLAPVSTGAPRVSGGSSVRSHLSCSQGSWATDLPGASLYRSPRSFTYHWLKSGRPISGATDHSYKPIAPGRYGCQVTAQNQAGSTTRTSVVHAVAGCVVPRLKGKTLRESRKALKRANCRLGKVTGPRSGTVKRQTPKPATVLAPGSAVNVRL